MVYKKWLMLGGVALLLAALLMVGWHWLQTRYQTTSTYTEARMVIDGQHTFRVRVADTAAKQVKGLGGTTSLADDEGMYFPLDATTSHSFWMKDMVMAIDIIWIKQGVVVGINHQVAAPESIGSDNDLIIYDQPTDGVDGVLEIRSGRAEELAIKVGSMVDPLIISQLD